MQSVGKTVNNKLGYKIPCDLKGKQKLTVIQYSVSQTLYTVQNVLHVVPTQITLT